MSRRRQPTPWLHRYSRYLIGAIAVLGAINTAYITITKLLGGETACPTKGCEQVLSSDYAFVFGIPLSLFGLLAYISMAVLALAPLAISADKNKGLRTQLENWSWLLMFAGSTAMVVFSAYLMYVMKTQFVDHYGIASICIYCIGSATLSTTLFILTLLGRTWEDLGQLTLTGVLVGMVVLIGSLGLYANVNNASAQNANPLAITTTSGPAELQLARHLRDTGAKMYGAFWCPHCHDQKQLFGRQAVQDLPYVECDPNGANSQTALCEQVAAKVKQQTGKDFGYPTWDINGQFYLGTQALEDLSRASNYQGPRNFQNPQ